MKGAAILDKLLTLSPIFCHQLVLIEQHNLWGQGSVRVGNSKGTTEATSFTDPSGTHALNVGVIFDITAAEKTLEDYFDHVGGSAVNT